MSTNSLNRRILVVDDNTSIHDDFRSILQFETGSETFELARSALFGGSIPIPPHEPFEVDCVDQGQAALAAREAARSEDRPYAIAFVDMRMPPGWDGLETIEHLWEADSRLQVVIRTAYSDQPWDEIRERIGRTDKLLIPQKPFNGIEALQLATALCRKWDLANKALGQLHELSCLVDERTAELRHANQQLTEMNGALMRTVANLQAAQTEILRQNDELERLASRDPLTGCLNRRAFYVLFEKAFAESPEHGSELCCLTVDIDDFKRVNDQCGHAVGDQAIQAVAACLSAGVRLTGTGRVLWRRRVLSDVPTHDVGRSDGSGGTFADSCRDRGGHSVANSVRLGADGEYRGVGRHVWSTDTFGADRSSGQGALCGQGRRAELCHGARRADPKDASVRATGAPSQASDATVWTADYSITSLVRATN